MRWLLLTRCYAPRWISIISYPTRTRGIIRPFLRWHIWTVFSENSLVTEPALNDWRENVNIRWTVNSFPAAYGDLAVNFEEKAICQECFCKTVKYENYENWRKTLTFGHCQDWALASLFKYAHKFKFTHTQDKRNW